MKALTLSVEIYNNVTQRMDAYFNTSESLEYLATKNIYKGSDDYNFEAILSPLVNFILKENLERGWEKRSAKHVADSLQSELDALARSALVDNNVVTKYTNNIYVNTAYTTKRGTEWYVYVVVKGASNRKLMDLVLRIR